MEKEQIGYILLTIILILGFSGWQRNVGYNKGYNQGVEDTKPKSYISFEYEKDNRDSGVWETYHVVINGTTWDFSRHEDGFTIFRFGDYRFNNISTEMYYSMDSKAVQITENQATCKDSMSWGCIVRYKGNFTKIN